MFLNDDTEVLPNWLQAMLAVIKNDNRVGVVGNKLLYPDHTIQHAGVWLLDHKPSGDPLLAMNSYVNQPRDFAPANQPMTYQAVTAACMLVGKDNFLRLGGFDEAFWNGYEDVDLCFRFGQQGYKVVYEPRSEVLHHESKSGAERFAKVKENIQRLHSKWLPKIKADYIVDNENNVHPTDSLMIAPYNPEGVTKNERPLVSIVMLTYNALDYTKMAFESIKANTDHPWEIIFVDNASTDGTKKYLRKLQTQHDNVTVVFNTENRGFSAGNNQGVEKANGEYVLFLNNDVLVNKGWLQNLVAAMEKDDGIGMVGPITNYISGLQMVRDIPYKDVSDFPRYAERVAELNKDKITPRRRIAGFAMLMDREVFKQLGGFDESFGSGNFEDDDLCLRVQKEDFAVMVHEGVYIHHFGSQTFKANKIDYNASLKKRGQRFREKWPDVDYEELLEQKNPLSQLLENKLQEAVQKWRQGALDEALQLYLRIFKHDPLNSEALLGISMLYNNKKQFDEALYYINKLIRLEPDSALAFNQSGIALMGKGEMEGAKSAFALAVEKDGAFIDAQRNYGDALIESGEYETGIKTFLTILNNHPQDIPSLLYLARINFEAGNSKEAVRYIEKVLAIDEENDLARQLKEMVEQEPAEKQTESDDVTGKLDQAAAFLEKGQVDQAEKIYIDVLEKEVNEQTALFGLALVCRLKENFTDAKAFLERSLQLAPGYIPALNQLGTIAMLEGEFEKAFDCFQKILTIEPGNAEAQNYMSDVLIQMGHYEEAVQLLNEAVKQHPQNAETLMRMGEVYFEASRGAEAAAYFEQVLDIQPHHEMALRYLQAIEH